MHPNPGRASLPQTNALDSLAIGRARCASQGLDAVVRDHGVCDECHAHVAAGSADNFVYVWDAISKRITYKLPGHTGAVNEVDFHPTQPIIASCGNDKQIYLGEIKSL